MLCRPERDGIGGPALGMVFRQGWGRPVPLCAALGLKPCQSTDPVTDTPSPPSAPSAALPLGHAWSHRRFQAFFQSLAPGKVHAVDTVDSALTHVKSLLA